VLGYLSHVDTVLADPGSWTHDPWSGEVHDGFLWGRGALDMKSQTAAEAVAAARLARDGWRPAKGALKIFSVVDEETGGVKGAKWLCENRPDLARADFLLNEGAGTVMPYGDRRLHGVCCAEKGTFRFAVRTRGRAGHASVPATADNALLKLAPAIERLGSRKPPYDVTDEPRAFLRAIGDDPDDPEGAVERLREVDPRLAALFEPTLGVTVAPTIISAGEKINVIPARAELLVDCRVPPGMGAEATMARIRELLDGVDGVEVEFIEQVVVKKVEVTVKEDDEEVKKAGFNVRLQTAIKIAKLYAPAALLLGASLGAITASHVVLRRRNAALTAAYAIVHSSFDEYRKRVRNELGAEKDLEFRFGTAEREIMEEGPNGPELRVIKGLDPDAIKKEIEAGRTYARIFDEDNDNWSDVPMQNQHLIQMVLNHARDALQINGHIFLSDVYDMLGFKRTLASTQVGWVRDVRIDPETGKQMNDGYIDFGLWSDGLYKGKEWVKGNPKAFLLDFNVDGVITDMLDVM
jgi:acetylornithine deacetylase/succinyl-diaminopimelate desuccinylase-like protein